MNIRLDHYENDVFILESRTQSIQWFLLLQIEHVEEILVFQCSKQLFYTYTIEIKLHHHD